MASLSLREGAQEIILIKNNTDRVVMKSKTVLPCLQKDEGFSLKFAWNGHETYWINGKKLHLAPGEALFINHRFVQRHRFESDRLGKGLCLYYSETEMRKLCESLYNAGGLHYDQLSNLREIKISKHQKLSSSLASLFRNFDDHNYQIREDILHYFWSDFIAELKPEIVLYSERLSDIAPGTRQALLRKIQSAEEFMRENLAVAIQLDDIAAEVGMSPFHFQRQYKKATGKSPSRSLVAWRMEKAQRLLVGDLQVMEIATMLAYNDLATFSKAFKREYGMSPKQWRKAQQINYKN